MKLKAISKSRYRANANERRIHGGSTVTIFWIDGGPRPIEMKGYGPTPGHRKTDALRRARELFDREAAGSPAPGPKDPRDGFHGLGGDVGDGTALLVLGGLLSVGVLGWWAMARTRT